MQEINREALVVNLFGGPGCGKSIFCADIFVHLKRKGISCEMALEYAKDLVWQDSLKVLENQLYIFGQQQHRIFRLKNKVDVIITDSPIINSIVYDAHGCKDLIKLILTEHRKYNNINFFIDRVFPYEKMGRIHDEEEAKILDEQILKVIYENKIPFMRMKGCDESTEIMMSHILTKIKK